jgi:hypothetical protein
MWRQVFVATLGVAVVSLGGCVIAIGNGGDEHAQRRQIANDDAVRAEIDAAGKLFSDSDKTGVYKDIAERDGLCGQVQAYLVKESSRHIFSDGGKEEVMLTLINNPCFDATGKQAVIANLNQMFSDSRKRRILKALDEREKQIIKATESQPVIEPGSSAAP